MKKKNFITLVLSTVGGLLFAIGMCMCLLPEWNAFTPGVVMAAVGAAVLIVMAFVRFKMDGRSVVKPNGRTVGAIALGVIGTLILGVGLCMTMVWEGLMIPGIIVGVVGIAADLFLIPLVKGLK